MKRMIASGLLVLLTACTPTSDTALSDALRPALAAHAAALVADGGPRSVSTGRKVIAIYEAAQ